MLDKLLNNILDVPHVEGLAIFNREGAVLLKRMPSLFNDELFGDLGRRIVSMTETVDENFIPCDDYLLKYEGKWIMLRRTEAMHLFLFCSENVNIMSLKMVTNMAFKQIKPEMLPPVGSAAKSAEPVSATNGSHAAGMNGTNGKAVVAPNGNGVYGANGTNGRTTPATNGNGTNGRAVPVANGVAAAAAVSAKPEEAAPPESKWQRVYRGRVL